MLAGPGFVTAAEQWFYIDAFSAFHIVVLVLVFLLSSAFAGVYFAAESGEHAFTPAVARRFGALWLGSLAAMMLVLVSNNLGIMWVGMEATTLLSAFLISLHPSRLSLEAMWKYLIICSIGIAFAFMGTLLAAAVDPVRRRHRGGGAVLDASRLRRGASRPDADEIRVRLRAGRLWHQGRAGADPFLAARCAQPGAGAGLGDVLGLSAEHGALLHHALCAAGAARARRRLSPAAC